MQWGRQTGGEGDGDGYRDRDEDEDGGGGGEEGEILVFPSLHSYYLSSSGKTESHLREEITVWD